MRVFGPALWARCLRVRHTALAVSVMLMLVPWPAEAQGKEHPVKNPTVYRSAQSDGLSTS